jgi:peptide chain release factor
VQLKHIPTGMMIKCQETRSREENRRIARRLLVRKLDVLENGEESFEGIRRWREVRKKKSREKKSKRKYRRLEEKKEGEGEKENHEIEGPSN